jgi:GNAT superfamily N-acetyltransferase
MCGMNAPALHVRPIRPSDREAWQPLWDGYNAFYGREGATALDPRITAQTWARFFDTNERVHALVAELDGRVVGIVHFLFHRSTSRLADVCYLQDLFTDPTCRGRGVGRALIERVRDIAREQGSSRLYWHTYETNTPGRALYDKVTKYAGAIVYTIEL